MKKLKVAVISCGMIANKGHLPAYRHYADRCDLAAVCDLNPQAAQDTAERFGVRKWYTDAEKMLAKERADLVSV